MKTKIMKNVKLISIFTIIIAIALFVTIKMFDEKTLNSVMKVLDTPIKFTERDIDWTIIKDIGVNTPEDIETLLMRIDPYGEIVRSDGLFMGQEHLRDIESILCCSLGTFLPALNPIAAGGYTRTDQGKYLRLLRMEDIGDATIGYKQATGWVSAGSGAPTILSGFTYNTVTFFPNSPLTPTPATREGRGKERRNATPKESWILTEYEENVRPTEHYAYDPSESITQSEYDNDPVKRERFDTYIMNEQKAAEKGYSIVPENHDGFIIYDINGSKYRLYDGQYYRVKQVSVGSSELEAYSTIQYAWWVDHREPDKESAETALAREAQVFQDYVEAVNGKQYTIGQVDDDVFDSNGLYKIDYLDNISLTPNYVKDSDFLWDPELNQYIIGPFVLEYPRWITQQEGRDKVDFCGITGVQVIGEDPQGNPIELKRKDVSETADSAEGDFQIIYEDDAKHTELQNELDRRDGDYPYPAPGEEFYIAVDFDGGEDGNNDENDDDEISPPKLVGIQSLDFDFQYVTAGAVYDYYEGKYLEVTFSQRDELAGCRWDLQVVGYTWVPEDDPRDSIGPDGSAPAPCPVSPSANDGLQGNDTRNNDYTITTSVENGRITIEGNKSIAKAMEPVTIRWVTPDEGYKYVSGSLKVEYTDESGNPHTVPITWNKQQDGEREYVIYTFTMPSANVVVSAEFEEDEEDDETASLNNKLFEVAKLGKTEDQVSARGLDSGPPGGGSIIPDPPPPTPSDPMPDPPSEPSDPDPDPPSGGGGGGSEPPDHTGEKQIPIYAWVHMHTYNVWLAASAEEKTGQPLGKVISVTDVYRHKIGAKFDGGSLDLTFRLAGQVWIDKQDQKDQSTGKIGLYDGEDIPIPDDPENKFPKDSVEIIVWQEVLNSETGMLERRQKAVGWDRNGNEINFRDKKLFVDEKGKYEVPRIQFPSMKNKQTVQMVYYDVEFIYDGQTYETTEYMVDGAGDTIASRTADYLERYAQGDTFYDNSLVTENASQRREFDATFAEISGDGAISGNTTIGKTNTTDVYYKDKNTPLSGDSGLEYESESYGETGYSKLKTRLKTAEGEWDEGRGLYEGKVREKYRFGSKLTNSGWWIRFTRMYIRRDDDKMQSNSNDDGSKDFKGNRYDPLTSWIENINLGLLERNHADVSAFKDLYSSKIVVNNQESPIATYNSLATLTEEDLDVQLEALNAQLNSKNRTTEYKIDLYNSDFNYRSSVYNTITDTITRDVITPIKDKSELRLFVTYKITLRNESVGYNATVNEFKDYYDETFTPILTNEQGTARIELTDLESDASGGAQYENRVVAYPPYYRKLKANAQGNTAGLYFWNKEDDLKAEGIDDGVTGELTFSDAKVKSGKYIGSVSGSLRGVSGNSVTDTSLILEPGECFEIFVTYEVDTEGFEEIQQAKQANEMNYQPGNERRALLGEKNNIVEITNYSTIYSEESKKRHPTTRYSVGDIAGRVDQDSAPDNLDMNAIDSLGQSEDDTEYAPVLRVNLRDPIERRITGIVWEDAKNEETAVGDGKYDSSESGVQNIDVTLVEKIRVTTKDLEDANGVVSDLSMLDYEFEFVWPDDAFGEAVTPKARTNSDGTYTLENFVSGDYVVRFEYGNTEGTLKYNGQDYKNTAYQKDKVNGVSDISDTGTYDIRDRNGISTLNNKWHDLSANDKARDLETDRVSDARDYEPRRMKVIAYSRTISNQNAEVLASYIDENDVNLTDEYKEILATNENKTALIEHTAMVANTAKLKLEVEKQNNITYSKTKDGKMLKTVKGTKESEDKYVYEVPNIDFGLVERPETKLYVRKEIKKIELMKNDGQNVILSVECDEDGNIIKATGQTTDGNVNVNKMTEIRKENLGLNAQGFKYVAMEASMLNGLDINLTYNISVINGSEKDYIGSAFANIKSIKDMYEKVERYETTPDSDIDSENFGLVPFNTGNGIIYGKYLGLHYYTNEVSTGNTQSKYGYNYLDDVEVTTTVDKVVDYIDNDISLNKQLTQNRENMSWNESTPADRATLLSRVSYNGNDQDKSDVNLVDNKNRSYIGTSSKNNIAVSNNETITMMDITYPKTKLNNAGEPETSKKDGMVIPAMRDVTINNAYTAKENISTNIKSSYNPSLTTALRSGESSNIGIVTSTHTNEETTDNMNYDNLVEIVVYSNTAGRRDMEAIPGNANMIAKQAAAYKASYGLDYSKTPREFIPTTVEVSDKDGKTTINTERDAFAPRDTITFTEPTGLSSAALNAQNNMILILSSLVSLAIIVGTAIIEIRLKKKW